ncbi:MAG: cyanophycinase [Aureliella sp.]
MFAALSGLDVGAACPQFVASEAVGSAASLSSTDLATASATGSKATKSSTKPAYEYSLTGNAADNTSANPTGGLALMGGGTAVDEAFRWLAEKANGGDFVVLTANSTKYYNNYVSNLAQLDSVETLVVPSREAANDPFVYDKIAHAEAIYINGGDQADYINFWTDTGLEDAIYAALNRHVPIGGSSAGLAVLGDIDFSAVNGSISSAEALADPLDPRITLDPHDSVDPGFLTSNDGSSRGTSLQLLDDVIAEPHFMQRDRMGRSMAFMARMDSDNLVTGLSRGIAVNEQTALLVDGTGTARVVGNPYSKKLAPADQQRTVYFAEGTTSDSLISSAPLNYTIHVQRAGYDPLTGVSDTFDLSQWTGLGVDAYEVTATDGVLSSSSGSIYG